MTPDAFALIFTSTLLASLGLRLWLAARQIRHVAAHADAVPPRFSGRVPLLAHQRAAGYTIARVRLGLAEAFVGGILCIALTLAGGLQWLQDAWAAHLPDHPFLRSVLLLCTVALLGSLVDLPLTWYRQFRLEQRFGFNRMTRRLWLADLTKATLVATALIVPLAALVLWLMREAGDAWWLWAWAAWAGFNVFLLLLYPTVIAPLFNTFWPMPDGPLRGRIAALMERCGFEARGLFMMDGSRRSAHGNAYFTGFGSAKRVVLYDTLLSRLDAAELEAVLAHELGHFRLGHVPRRLATSLGLSFAALWLLGRVLEQPWFFGGLGVSTPLDREAIALVLFLVALPVFTFPLQPVAGFLSRRQEFQADAYATRHAEAPALASALVKLYADNATTLTPDPAYSAFYDSHPPAPVRIARLGLPDPA